MPVSASSGKNAVSKLILLSVQLLALTAFLSLPVASAQTQSDPSQYRNYYWRYWQPGFETGTRALGKFGRGDSINLPPGDVMPFAAYHLWFQHLIEVHFHVGYGLTNSTFA